MAATKSKELTFKQLEKQKLSNLYKEYLNNRKKIIEEFNIMKIIGKYKIMTSEHRGITSLNFSCDDFWTKYGSYLPADKNLIEKLLELYPPDTLYYHRSTFVGIYREGDSSIKENGTTILIFPIYISREENDPYLTIKWKTKTHDISIKYPPSKTKFSLISRYNNIKYSGGHSITYFDYREKEDLNILEYIL